MDKTPFLVAQGVTSYDLNNISKDAQKGLGWAVASLLGGQKTVIDQFVCTQTVTPSLILNLSEGHIYTPAVIDSAPIGTLLADPKIIEQQGYSDVQTVSLNTTGLTAGQSKWFLIQVSFLQQMIIRPGDNGRRGFYNSAAPASPLNGIDGLGGSIPTCVNGLAQVTVISGTAGVSPVPPAPSANCSPMYLILMSYGQTAVTQAQILVAGPAAYAGYQQAPFLSGLLNQHHLGINGHAPKIDLTSEIQNICPFPNLPVSNTTPPTVAGTVTRSGKIPVLSECNTNPNGNVAGQAQDLCYNAGVIWYCTTAGPASGGGQAVWVAVGAVASGGGCVVKTAFPFTPLGGNTYLCDTTTYGSAGTATMNAASTYGGAITSFKNVGAYVMSVYPTTGESLSIGDLAINLPITLNPGEQINLGPRSGSGFYVVT